jgi:hypothetical protein
MESPWPSGPEEGVRVPQQQRQLVPASRGAGFNQTSHFSPRADEDKVVEHEYAVKLGKDHTEETTAADRDTPVYGGDAGPQMSVLALRRETRLANFLTERTTPVEPVLEPIPEQPSYIMPPPAPAPQFTSAPLKPVPPPATPLMYSSGGSCGCLDARRTTIIVLVLLGLAFIFCFASFFGPWSYSKRVETGASGIVTWRYSWQYDYYLTYFESGVTGQEFTYRTSDDWRRECHHDGTWAAILFNALTLVILIPTFILALVGYKKDSRKLVLASMILCWVCFVFFFLALGFWLLGCHDVVDHYITSARSTDASDISNKVRVAWGWGFVLFCWLLAIIAAVLQTIHFRVLSTGFSGAAYLYKGNPTYTAGAPAATGATLYGPGLAEVQYQQQQQLEYAQQQQLQQQQMLQAGGGVPPPLTYEPAPAPMFSSPARSAGPGQPPVPAAARVTGVAQGQGFTPQGQSFALRSGGYATGAQLPQTPGLRASPSASGDFGASYDAAAALAAGNESPHHLSYAPRAGPVTFHGGSPSHSRARGFGAPEEDLAREYELQQQQQQFTYGARQSPSPSPHAVEMQSWRTANY